MKRFLFIFVLGLFSIGVVYADKGVGEKVKEDAQTAKEAFIKFGEKAKDVGEDIAEGAKKSAQETKEALDKKKKK